MSDHEDDSPIIDIQRSDSTELIVQSRSHPKYKYQFLAALIASMAPICAGLIIGYSSPAVPDMNKPGRRLPVDDTEKSIFSSIVNIGALIGGLLAGFLVDYFGRKLGFIITCIPCVIGWLLITYADSMWELYLGRIVTGACIGLFCLNTSIYITEIASPQIRGILGSFFQLFLNFGILLAYLVGSYVSWSYLAMFSAAVPVFFMFCISFMPESPVWLLRTGNEEGARQSMIVFRGETYDVASELDVLKREKLNEVSMSFRELRNPVIFKPLLIVEMEMFFQQFCGINAVVFNVVSIFEIADSSLSPNQQAMIVGLVMVVGSIVASVFIDKAGRRVLLMICAIFMAASSYVLGTFYYWHAHAPQLAAKVTWLPVVCLVVFVFVFNLGFGPIPWLSMSEFFPAKARSIASSVVTTTSWSLAFVVTVTFRDLQTAILPYGVFWLYGSVSLIAVGLVWFCVPETKGKTHEEIQNCFT